MSFPLSTDRLHGPEALAALGIAAVRVAEDSLFTYAEPCDAGRTSAMLRDRGTGEPWLVASVAFTGPFVGAVRVSLPATLAADLAYAFCGIAADELAADQVADFAGELTNMVCGLWLTQTHRAERFELAAPRVVAAAAADVARGFDPAAGAFGIALNDAPVVIALAPASQTAA
jgi:hypothetical protein